MKFKGNVMRNAFAAVLAVWVLASCGGASQVESFVPARIVAFGDEYSVIDGGPNGRKYTINAIKYEADGTTPTVPTTLLCAANVIWVQELGISFGMAFDQCKDAAAPTQVSKILAVAGGGADDLAVQIKAFTDTDSFATNDLVTVWTGTNDIIAIYEDYKTNAGVNPILLAEEAGRTVGAGVITITGLGAKVIVSTIPDLGFSPYAVKEENLQAGRAKLLSDMSKAFNTQLRLKLEQVANGGRSVGLVLADDLLRSFILYPTVYGFANTQQGACALAAGQDLRDCTPLTLVTGATAASYLWADDIHLGPVAQTRIGDLAISRARNNPF